MTGRGLAAILLLSLLGCGPPAAPPPQATAADPATSGTPAWFEESARARGIDFQHRSGHGKRHLFPEIIGGGAALFDMDQDGDLDAYLVQSGSLAAPAAPGGNRLFENQGDGSFADVTPGSGAEGSGYGMGVAVGDFDNDGDPDLFVTNYGPQLLLRNEGGGKFTDATRVAGVGAAGWGTSSAFLDYDRDGDLDLFVANYVHWSPAIEQDCYNPSGLPDYCLPTNYGAPAMDTLYRNEGNGKFTNVTREVGLHTSFGNGLGVVCSDFDGDGWVDIFVANDTMMNQLWINDGHGRFADEALLRGCALDEHGMAKAGMGVAAGDVDDDGDDDLLVVNLQGQTDSYFRNDSGYFTDLTGSAGLGTTSRSFTRFGTGLADFDNDGWLDLYEASGRVVMSPEPEAADPYAEADLLFQGQPNGRFVEVLPRGGTREPLWATSRGSAFGDVNGDGGIDVLVVNRDGPAHLLLNVLPRRGHWVEFRVLDEHGRDALGARVSFQAGERRITREVRAAYSYCASSDPRVHAGLGAAEQARNVTVRWLDGQVESFGDAVADGVVLLRRASGS